MDPIDWTKKIELEYSVEEIKYNNIAIWPALRSYVRFAILRKKYGQVNLQQANLNKGTISVLLKNMLVGIKYLFRRRDFFIFSSSKCRILLQGIYHDRVLGGVSEILSEDSLYFENPYPNGLPKPVITNNRISESSLHLLAHLYQLVFFRKSKMAGLEVWNKLLEDLDIEVNIVSYAKRFVGQHGIMKLLLNYHKPKAVFLISSNTLSGYIYAFKKKNIPVIELQHGVISKKHASYNVFKDIGRDMRPDYLCVYSDITKQVFSENNYFINPKNVESVGYHFLDFIRHQKISNKRFEELSGAFLTKVCVSMSDSAIDDTLQYIVEAAKLDTRKFFALIPRSIKKYSNWELPFNVKIIDWLNVYECIKLCDFHSTVLSTCAMEAPCLGVQNIIISIDSRSRQIFKGMLEDDSITQFADTPEEYLRIMDNMPILTQQEIVNKSSHLVKPEFTQNMKDFVTRFL